MSALLLKKIVYLVREFVGTILFKINRLHENEISKD